MGWCRELVFPPVTDWTRPHCSLAHFRFQHDSMTQTHIILLNLNDYHTLDNLLFLQCILWKFFFPFNRRGVTNISLKTGFNHLFQNFDKKRWRICVDYAIGTFRSLASTVALSRSVLTHVSVCKILRVCWRSVGPTLRLDCHQLDRRVILSLANDDAKHSTSLLSFPFNSEENEIDSWFLISYLLSMCTIIFSIYSSIYQSGSLFAARWLNINPSHKCRNFK